MEIKENKRIWNVVLSGKIAGYDRHYEKQNVMNIVVEIGSVSEGKRPFHMRKEISRGNP